MGSPSRRCSSTSRSDLRRSGADARGCTTVDCSSLGGSAGGRPRPVAGDGSATGGSGTGGFAAGDSAADGSASSSTSGGSAGGPSARGPGRGGSRGGSAMVAGTSGGGGSAGGDSAHVDAARASSGTACASSTWPRARRSRACSSGSRSCAIDVASSSTGADARPFGPRAAKVSGGGGSTGWPSRAARRAARSAAARARSSPERSPGGVVRRSGLSGSLAPRRAAAGARAARPPRVLR